MFGYFGKRRAPPPKATGPKTTGGVFVSTRSLLTTTEHSVAGTENGSTSSMDSSQHVKWHSAGSKNHNLNSPMVVSDPDHPDEVIDEEAAICKIKERSRRLPTEWCYSSNHVMVNQERTKETIAPLTRMYELDTIARLHAEAMADEERIFHSDPTVLHHKFNRPCRRLGENVAKGPTIKGIHWDMMQKRAQKNNITDRRFTHMGMGTSRGSDGDLYLCQIFRG